MMNTLIVYACISVTHEWNEIRGNNKLVVMEPAQSWNARSGSNPDMHGSRTGRYWPDRVFKRKWWRQHHPNKHNLP